MPGYEPCAWNAWESHATGVTEAIVPSDSLGGLSCTGAQRRTQLDPLWARLPFGRTPAGEGWTREQYRPFR